MLQYQNIYAEIIRYGTYSIKKINTYEILHKYAYFSVKKNIIKKSNIIKK